jgi:hypothetical protein
MQGNPTGSRSVTRLHETVFKKSVHQGRIEELTFVAPDVAIVRGYIGFPYPANTEIAVGEPSNNEQRTRPGFARSLAADLSVLRT